MCPLLTLQDRDSPRYTKCLEALLSPRPPPQQLVLNEFSLEVIDAVLLGLDAVDNLLPHLLVLFGQVLKETAVSSDDFTKGTRYSKFLVNALKRLPRQVPKECLEAVSQAVHATKSFLKKAAEAELKKISPQY